MTDILIEFYPEILILAVSWIAYGYVVVYGGHVSDDIAGIAEYDGKLQGWEYGMVSRWLRYHICGGNFPSAKKLPNGTVIPQGKLPRRHHVLIILVFNIGAILAYEFLKQVIGGKLALLAILLFVVHPCGVQAVAWSSALGYPLSLLWIGAMLNLVLLHSTHSTAGWTIVFTLLFCVFQFLGIHAQVVPCMTWAILLLLGYWQFAALGFFVSAVMMLDIVKQTIDFRAGEFKKQNMGQSTSLNPRKIIVALKTFFYYVKLALWPNKMGLYHKWGFHYGPDLEREDWRFFAGLTIFVASGLWFWYTPSLVIKLGLLWFSSFIFIFLNWVTIQQFVTERYLFIPSLGVCLLIAYFTFDYPILYGLIFGAFLCRTWLHLPTYDNEMRFYQSNVWNFPDSEVAYGNLGVTQMRVGLNGSSMDSWMLSTQLNPDYDVPWYNIFSTYRANAMSSLQHGQYDAYIGQLRAGLPYLQKTLACKICHFPENWKKEQADIMAMINNPKEALMQEKARLEALTITLPKLKENATDPQRLLEVDISIQNNAAQLANLNQYLAKNVN